MRSKSFTHYLVSRFGVQTLLVAAIVIVGFLLVEDRVVRWDLTEDSRFSISEASHDLARSLEDPLTIRAYFSDNLPPRLEPLQRQIFDILAEYEAQSGGKIKVERYDPQESLEAEGEAKNYGIRPVQLQVFEATQASALEVYGSIVLLYRDRASEVINIAERYPEGYEGLSVLEYEISSKIWQLANEKPKVGLTGNLMSSPQFNPMMGMGRPQPRPEFSGLRRILGDVFEVEDVDLKDKEPDPAEIPLLIVIRPKEFTDVEVFRLDQYVVKGGRVLMLITQGTIESSYPPPGTRQEGMFKYTPFKTGLDEWLAFQGLRVPNEFVLHWRNAYPIRVMKVIETELGRMRGLMPEPNWFWPIFGAEGSINQENPAVKNLETVLLFWPHPVDILQDKLDGKTATVLLQSHKAESWRWKELTRVDRRYLDQESDGPSPSSLRASPVAVAVEGKFKSFFADKPVPPSLTGGDKGDKQDESGDEEKTANPESEEKQEGAGKDEEEKAPEAKPGPEVVKEGAGTTQLVVIGNSVFVSDLILGGQGGNDDRAKLAGLLAFNLVDWLARSKALIALRAKKYTKRSLIDESFDADLESLNEEASKGEITNKEYNRRRDELGEQQKQRWKFWRWLNVLVPGLFSLVVGAVVWVLRAAVRARRADVPAAVPPRSVTGSE